MYVVRCVYVVNVGAQQRRCLPGARALRYDNGRQQSATARPTTNGTRACGARGWRLVHRPTSRGTGGNCSAAAITTLHRRAAGEARPMARAPRLPTTRLPGTPPRTTQQSFTPRYPSTLHLSTCPPRYLSARRSGVFPTGRTNWQRLYGDRRLCHKRIEINRRSPPSVITDLGDFQNIVAGRLIPDHHRKQ